MVCRCACAGAVGALLQLLFLWLVRSYWIFQVVSLFVLLPVLVVWVDTGWGGSQKHRSRPFPLSDILLCLGLTFLLGGAATALETIGILHQLPFLAAVTAGLLLFIFAGQLYRGWKKGRRMLQVTLQNGRYCCEIMALWDSGNLLRESESGKPVHIISRRIAEDLHLTEETAAGIARFRTISQTDGILKTWCIDRITIATPKQRDPGNIVAVAAEGILEGERYQMILNAECGALSGPAAEPW